MRILALHPFCFYCGRSLTVETVTIDHVIPRAKSRGHAYNCVPACQKCNGKKADRDPSPEELSRLDRLYPQRLAT